MILTSSSTTRVVQNGTLIFPYPSGTTAASFVLGASELYVEGIGANLSEALDQFDVVLGVSNVTVTYKHATPVPAVTRVLLDLALSDDAELISPDSFGAGRTHVELQAALDRARDAGGGEVYPPPGTEWAIGATVEVWQNVFLNMEGGGWLKPSANVDVLRVHGGGRAFARIDTRDLSGWSSSALVFDGDSEGSASTAFRLDTPTEVTAHLYGASSGSNGNAIEFTAETATKSWLMGIKLTAWVKNFDIACKMAVGSGDRFCNSNDIWISASNSLQGLVMSTAQTYAVDHNRIELASQIRPSVSANPHVVIVGQLNKITALPWDWDGGVGGIVKAITIGANARDSDFILFAEESYVTDSSTAGQNRKGLFGTDTLALTYRDANGDTWLKGSSVAGDIVNIDAANATGQVLIRVNNAIAFGTDANRHFYFPGNAGAANAVSIRNFNTAAYNQDICNGAGILSIKAAVPASAAAAGALGMWAEDDSYFYVCIAANTWKRVAISTW